nr:MAG TPA: hypothetical protein [Caudoviricetes sp.]
MEHIATVIRVGFHAAVSLTSIIHVCFVFPFRVTGQFSDHFKANRFGVFSNFHKRSLSARGRLIHRIRRLPPAPYLQFRPK